jgi:hypothetical protein
MLIDKKKVYDIIKKNFTFLIIFTLLIKIGRNLSEIMGTNRWNLQDANGKYIIRSLAETAKNGGGFVNYIYANPERPVNPKIK